VGWRLEHVLTKWDMLAALRLSASRSQSDQLPEMYSDIELEVRLCPLDLWRTLSPW
jgi:hypothetical protein